MQFLIDKHKKLICYIFLSLGRTFVFALFIHRNILKTVALFHYLGLLSNTEKSYNMIRNCHIWHTLLYWQSRLLVNKNVQLSGIAWK